MMILQQTVEIPADHRLLIDVPEEIPAGTATFRLEWIKPPVNPKKDSAEEAIEALCGLYAGVDTLDAYMERHHAEKDPILPTPFLKILRCCP
jgi:hypothetical protein